jgi:Xaa-Pro dipeptidase
LTGYLDRERARHMMSASGLDALLLCTPEDFFYGTGYASMVFELYRQAPMAMVLLPADNRIDPAIIAPEIDLAGARRASGISDARGYPLWVERYALDGDAEQTVELEPLVTNSSVEQRSELPEQYDREHICRLLATILRDRRLDQATIGLEMDFVDVNTYAMLQRANEAVDFVDSTSLMDDLRCVKSSAEIEWLRKACHLTESGIRGGGASISLGAGEASVRRALSSAVWSAAERHGLTGVLDGVSGQIEVTGPAGSTEAGLVNGEGAVVKFDVQVRLSHYHSDVGRSYVYGGALTAQRRAYKAVFEAHSRARDSLRPGFPISEVFETALDTFRRADLGFGHSVGLDPKIEEPPFISATEQRPLAPGMVLALETPLYITGLGAYQLEDMCLVTGEGVEILSTLPRELQEVLFRS